MDIIVPRSRNFYENVRGYQLDTKTGLYIRGSAFEDTNTIQAAMKNYLALLIAANSTDRAMDALFTDEGGATEEDIISGQDAKDGIAYQLQGDYGYVFETVLQQGGDNATSYIEFQGHLAADATTSDISWSNTYDMVLGHNYDSGGPGPFETLYSSYKYALEINQGRTFYFYWRITAT